MTNYMMRAPVEQRRSAAVSLGPLTVSRPVTETQRSAFVPAARAVSSQVDRIRPRAAVAPAVRAVSSQVDRYRAPSDAYRLAPSTARLWNRSVATALTPGARLTRPRLHSVASRRSMSLRGLHGLSSQEQIMQAQLKAARASYKARKWWEDRQTGVLGNWVTDGTMTPVYYVAALASGAVSAYHGVKRNNGSVGWGVGWFILGSAFPVVVPVIAFAQGFAKPKAKKNRRRTSRR